MNDNNFALKQKQPPESSWSCTKQILVGIAPRNIMSNKSNQIKLSFATMCVICIFVVFHDYLRFNNKSLCINL